MKTCSNLILSQLLLPWMASVSCPSGQWCRQSCGRPDAWHRTPCCSDSSRPDSWQHLRSAARYRWRQHKREWFCYPEIGKKTLKNRAQKSGKMADFLPDHWRWSRPCRAGKHQRRNRWFQDRFQLREPSTFWICFSARLRLTRMNFWNAGLLADSMDFSEMAVLSWEHKRCTWGRVWRSERSF